MERPITRRRHGVADYTYVPAVLAAPKLAGFADDPTPTRLAAAFSGVALLSSAFTRAEWGVVKVVPFRAHLAIDVLSGVAALAAPWLFGFSENRRARDTFLAMGVIGLAAGLLTEPTEMAPGAGSP